MTDARKSLWNAVNNRQYSFGYFKLQTFVYMAIFGLNNALIPITAFHLGAKYADRIKKVIRLSGVYSALIGLVGLIIMEMLPVQLISGYASAGHYWRASSASEQGSQRTGRGDSEGIDLCLNEGDEVVYCDLIVV